MVTTWRQGGLPENTTRGRRLRRWPVTLVALLAGGCIQSPVPPVGGTATERLARLEALYGDARELYFQVYVTEARGVAHNERGRAVDDMRRTQHVLGERVLEGLARLDVDAYGDEDRRAITVMRQTLSDQMGGDTAAERDSAASCDYDPAALAAGPAPLERLQARIYRCYGAQATHVVTPTDTADRLTVLARLGTEPSAERRQALFRSLEPMWRAVNGDGSPRSPWRTMVALSAARWRAAGSPLDAAARSLGLDPAATESTLVRILATWRDHTPATPLEPWDWYHANGEASRTLSPRITREALRTINDRFYREQGADPVVLDIRYDLDPRPGKTPVAFAQFGKPARRRGDDYGESEAWVFATYRTGGFDNLIELLHETGHAIHVSAVATRPAFADWPDSDPFTEALGDLLAMEGYEPAWQQRYLGGTAALPASLRAKYASVALDVAWALFELRMHRDPAADPNAVWSAITAEYLHIVPHPEWSWWAMRGQLVGSPGYMMNYALGAMITAALRERVREARGTFSRPDEGMYDWLSDRLYRWGRERPTREVLRDFLGRPLTVEALVGDMSRLPR